MKHLLLSLLFLTTVARAETTMKLNFENEDIVKILENYSKATGQKIIVDPGVRGKISIFNQQPVDVTEAFNQISTACAVNGFAIVKQGDTYLVMQGRQAQRNGIEVTTTVPTAKPERMVSYIVTLKYIPAAQVQREVMSMFASRDGEYRIYEEKNQIIMSDWSSNLNRVAEVIKTLDQPTPPETTKIVEKFRKEDSERRAKMEKMRGMMSGRDTAHDGAHDPGHEEHANPHAPKPDPKKETE